MRLVPLVLAALVSIPLAAFACGNSMRYERVYDAHPDDLLAAQKAFNEGRFADVLAAVDKVFATRRLVEEGREGRLDASARVIEMRVYSLRGLSELALRHYPEALAALSSARAYESENAFLNAKYGEALVRVGRPRNGADVLEPLATKDALPDAATWTALAIARQKKGDRAGALKAAQAALQLGASEEASAIVESLATPPKATGVKLARTNTRR